MRVFCFGFGFSATALARSLRAEGHAVAGTRRSPTPAEDGISIHAFATGQPLADPAQALAGTTHLVLSIPPGREGDPVLIHHADAIRRIPTLEWIGYLSTTGVYGDTGGAVVDETAPTRPTSERSQFRVDAEKAWLDLGSKTGIVTQVFRLAGIYGPGRSVFDQIRSGTARRVVRPDHKFSRIHVDDIAGVVRAAMAKPLAGAIYNVCDDEPTEAAEVVAYACRLLGREPPPLVDFDVAAKQMSPMALSFWRDNRRVANRLIKSALGVGLRYPTYREGLAAILSAGG